MRVAFELRRKFENKVRIKRRQLFQTHLCLADKMSVCIFLSLKSEKKRHKSKKDMVINNEEYQRYSIEKGASR